MVGSLEAASSTSSTSLLITDVLALGAVLTTGPRPGQEDAFTSLGTLPALSRHTHTMSSPENLASTNAVGVVVPAQAEKTKSILEGEVETSDRRPAFVLTLNEVKLLGIAGVSPTDPECPRRCLVLITTTLSL